MTITNIKQLIDIVLDSSRKGYFPELVINGETYDIWIKGLITFDDSRTIRLNNQDKKKG